MHDGRVLLHRHARQGLWLPPGGHIERDELPQDAAIREIEEETGLRLRLHSEKEAEQLERAMEVPVVPQPAFILIEPINPFHQHIDFIYFAEVEDEALRSSPFAVRGKEAGARQERTTTPRGYPEQRPTSPFLWFGPDDLDAEGVPRNVKEGALMAITYFASDPAGESPHHVNPAT